AGSQGAARSTYPWGSAGASGTDRGAIASAAAAARRCRSTSRAAGSARNAGYSGHAGRASDPQGATGSGYRRGTARASGTDPGTNGSASAVARTARWRVGRASASGDGGPGRYLATERADSAG